MATNERQAIDKECASAPGRADDAIAWLAAGGEDAEHASFRDRLALHVSVRARTEK